MYLADNICQANEVVYRALCLHIAPWYPAKKLGKLSTSLQRRGAAAASVSRFSTTAIRWRLGVGQDSRGRRDDKGWIVQPEVGLTIKQSLSDAGTARREHTSHGARPPDTASMLEENVFARSLPLGAAFLSKGVVTVSCQTCRDTRPSKLDLES